MLKYAFAQFLLLIQFVGRAIKRDSIFDLMSVHDNKNIYPQKLKAVGSVGFCNFLRGHHIQSELKLNED